MPRIRTIKPEFPLSESIGRLSRDARLLLVLLLTVVDDAGRARAAPQLLSGQLYPYDGLTPDMIEGWLQELEHEHHIRRYEVGGSRYLEITKFLQHQKIDKPSPSRLPAFAEASPQARLDFGEASPNTRGALTPVSGPVPGPGPVSGSEPDSVADATSGADAPCLLDDPFEQFKQVYPKRQGSQPWKPAKAKFVKLCRNGADPETIIAGARRYAADLQRAGKAGTVYVAQAITWLNQERWRDDAAPSVRGQSSSTIITVTPGTPEWDQWRAHYADTNNTYKLREMNRFADKGAAFPVPQRTPPPASAAA